jgi:thiamine pyrophosphate-dependent acetolactate synthase large subunit-like protein
MLSNADWAKIAESMGCLGLTVTQPSQLGGALDQALASGRPAVVDVKTHIDGIAPPPWLPA